MSSRDPRISRIKSKLGEDNLQAITKILKEANQKGPIDKSSQEANLKQLNHKKNEYNFNKATINLVEVIIEVPIITSLFCADSLKNQLVKKSSTPSVTDISNQLRFAVSDGNINDLANILLLPEPPNVNGDIEPSLLTLASHSGYTDIVCLLLRHGANVNHQSHGGSTALMAAADGGHNLVVLVLLKWGSEVNLTNTNMETALLKAIHRGNLNIVKMLLEHGANPQPCNGPNQTYVVNPLLLARQLHHEEIAEEILAYINKLERYMCELVETSLPVGAGLADAGNRPRPESLSGRTPGFIPVQQLLMCSAIVSGSTTCLTFNTPPFYAESVLLPMEGIVNELILLYIACVSIKNNQICAATEGLRPTIAQVSFNGMCGRPKIELSPRTEEQSEETMDPASYCVFLLANHLREGGLNTLSMDTYKSLAAQEDNVRSLGHNHYKRHVKKVIIKPTESLDQEKQPGPDDRMLVGIYRVRIDRDKSSSSQPGGTCCS